MKASSLLFVGLGIAFISLTSYMSKQKAQIECIINQLQFRVSEVKNIRVSLQHFALDVAIQAVNPTSEHLSINTGFISAKVLRVYERKTDKLLAFSNLNTNAISIPSGGYYQLPYAHVKIPLLTGGQLLVNELVKKQKNIQEDFIKAFRFELDVEALGKTQTIQF